MMKSPTPEEVAAYYDGLLPHFVADRERGNPRVYKTLNFIINKMAVDVSNVLDIGCGTGITTEVILANGAANVFGVDISPKLIECAIDYRGNDRNPASRGAVYHVLDITQSPLPSYAESWPKFHAITMFDCFEHLPMTRLDFFFENIKILAPGADIFMTIPDGRFTDLVKHNQPELLQIIDNAYSLTDIERIFNEYKYEIADIEMFGIDAPNQYMYLHMVPYAKFYAKMGEPFKKVWAKG